MLHPELLAILACPACEARPPLELRGAYLVCLHCHRAYPIRDEIPVLLIEEAVPWDTVQDANNPAREAPT
ncbi:MAG: Trm112 family protein [Fimbriimonadales bacterium]